MTLLFIGVLVNVAKLLHDHSIHVVAQIIINYLLIDTIMIAD